MSPFGTVKVSLSSTRGTFDLTGEDIGLAEWPEWFDGFELTHRWDEESGAYRGVFPSGVTTLTLKVNFRGRGIAERASHLFEILGEPGSPVNINVTSAGSVRRIETRFVAPGATKWHGKPMDSVFAELPLQFEAVNPVWLGGSRSMTVDSSNLGWLSLPYAGTIPDWPTFRVSGGYTGVNVRFRAGDSSAMIPNPGAGFDIVTNPQGRGMFRAGTGALVPGAVYWPEAPELTNGGLRVYVGAQSPTSTFKTVIEYTERWNRAW